MSIWRESRVPADRIRGAKISKTLLFGTERSSNAERIQLLGGISIAMAADVAELTQIERPPRDREEVPVQLSRLLDAHPFIIRETRALAQRAATLGHDGTNGNGS